MKALYVFRLVRFALCLAICLLVACPRPPHAGQTKVVSLPGGARLTLVWIPAGSFEMGRRAGELDSDDSERPLHRVDLDGFWLGRDEVTQAQWNSLMTSDPSYFGGANLPVETVMWSQAKAFISALNAHTHKHYRLPSEAEWEYACRAGTATRFYWGDDLALDDIDEYTWNSENAESETHIIGGKMPNAWGLYDMGGNVGEWCEDDRHDDYYDAPSDGSAWVDSPRDTSRVIRGGDWFFPQSYCRSAARNFTAENSAYNFLGFRVAL